MTLIRILLIALVAWLILRMIKTRLDRHTEHKKTQTDQIGAMVKCHHCGLHIPKQEAIESANHYYCSQEHRQLEQQDD
ncbi:MAG: PP0621 family protein [Gammaproteobacteria bacterium]|nr:PP0621 family protein [Gammaproteobacteria bacterium]MDH5776837.1 PP0621 family protein [Gammaproteobacteria bacterium]